MMFDIMKKLKSRRIAQLPSKMLLKKAKPNLRLLSCLRMRKKNKKNIIDEMPDNMSIGKTNEDFVELNGTEQSNPGMRCNATCDFDSLQAVENPSSVETTVESLRKKQKERSFGDNGRVKELEACESAMVFSSQDNLQKHVHVIIDRYTCKVTIYSDATCETKAGTRIVEKNNEKYGKTREYSNFQSETWEVEKKRKDVLKASQLNVCRPETGEDVDEIWNRKPTAIILPTRHQTNTIYVASPVFVERNAVEADESTVGNTNNNTVVNTDEDSHFCTADGSLNMEPTSEYDSEDTSVKVMDSPSSMQSRSFEDNSINVTPLQERDNTSFEEFSFSSFGSFSSAGQEMVQETEDVRTCSRNYNYSQDQISKNENKKEAVVGIQMLCPTDTQYQDIYLAQSDDIQSSQESGHSPHSIGVYTSQEGKTASHQHQMFIKLDHDMNCSSTCDLPDSVITSMTEAKLVQKVDHLESVIVAKLVQKIDHLESVIDRLSKLVLFPVRSNSRIPGSLKDQDLVISKCQENCKSYLNDGVMICHIKGDMFQITPLPASNVIHPEYWEQVRHCSGACVCQAYNTLESESLLYNKVRQVSPPAGCYILPDEMNSISSASIGQGKAKKTKKMPKVPKDSQIGEPANQPLSMLMLERPMWNTGAESDEKSHTLSLQINLSEENLHHNLDLKENLEEQAEMSSLVAELNKIKSSRGARNCSFSEEIIIVGMGDAETHEPDSLQLKDREEKDMNHNEYKSRFLSETSFAQSINLGHTKMTSVENTENDVQLEMAPNSTTPEYASAVDSSGYSENNYTDAVAIPMIDSKPTFINSDPDVARGRESVKDLVWNKLNLERDETTVSTSKLNLEAADSSSSDDSSDESCLHQKENVMGLSSSVLKVEATDCCLNADASDASCLNQMDNNINISPVKTGPLELFSEMNPVISDQEHIPDHGISAQHEDSQQKQASVGYSSDHSLQVQDKSKEEFTTERQSIQDCIPKKPRANEFVSGSKVQKGKGTRSILEKKKSLQRSKSGTSCRLCSLQRKRRGKKRKVKTKKNIEHARKVSHEGNPAGILNDLKIFLHYLASSFAQDTVQSGSLTRATMMRKGKSDFATELDIVENGSQERLIDDFLQSLVSTWFIFPTIKNGLQTVVLLPTGLQLYFERLLRGTLPEERERMSYEWLRLQTFINYPSSAPGSGVRFARAGFYYSGNGTVTVCYACGAQHSGWCFHDDPYEIHRRISPDCPFLRGNPTYPNVPIMQQGEQIGIQIESNASNMPLSPNNSNRTSGMPPSAASQSQILTVTQFGAQPSAAILPSIHNSQERGSDQQASRQTMSKIEHSLGTVPHSINLASSAHVDEIPSVIDQPVTLTAAVVHSFSEESQEGQPPTTAATTPTRPQQPIDDRENTRYRSPGNFVLIKPAGQVEDHGVDPTPQTMSERPRHPEYAPLSSRVHSYTGWPTRLDQTPQQMAEAGFFYPGIMDYTCCFQCGGGLRNWEPGDNPWVEHARWYPQCAYVLGKKGQKFVNAVLKKHAELLAAQSTERNNSNTTITTTTSSGATSNTGQPRYFQNPNENEIANRLINEIGYQRERVREAILEIKRRRGQKEIAVEHVIELLLADEERRARDGRQNKLATVEELIQESGQLTLYDDSNTPPAIPPPTAKTTKPTQPSSSSGHLNQVARGRSSGQQQNGQKNGQTNQPIAPGSSPSVPQSQLNVLGPMSIAVDVPSSSSAFGNREGYQSNKSSASNRPSSPPKLEPTSLPAFNAESLKEEYLRLLGQNLCKICMERNVELVFLPCGHLVCCEVCGQTLRFCPICRAKIQASVKTYLS